MMPIGKVKSWGADKGYGFIVPDDGGPDVFVHISQVMSSINLQHDQFVSYEVELNERNDKPQATRVRVLEG